MQNNKGRHRGAGSILSLSFSDLNDKALRQKGFLDDRVKMFIRNDIIKYYKSIPDYSSHPQDDFLVAIMKTIKSGKPSNKIANEVRLLLSQNPQELVKLKLRFVQHYDWKTRLYGLLKIKYIGEIEAEERIATKLLNTIFNYIEKPSRLTPRPCKPAENEALINLDEELVVRADNLNNEVKSPFGDCDNQEDNFDESQHLDSPKSRSFVGDEEHLKNIEEINLSF